MTPARARKAGGSAVSWERAREVLAAHRRNLLRRKDVVGVDLGIKRSEGVRVEGPCIRLHVRTKRPESDLHPRQVLPRSIDGIPVDIVESRFGFAECPSSSSRHRRSVRPLVGGVSIGLFGEDAFGTMGAIVLDADGVPGGLTCAHVCRAGETVRQRHLVGRRIGDVLAEADTAEVDAAFIMFRDEEEWRAEVLGIGAVESEIVEITPSDLPFAVELVGACSGRRQGKVVSLAFSGWVEGPNGQKFVRDQMCIERDADGVFSRQGDSGGGVIAGRRFVGILIAAGRPELGGTGLATPIVRVLSRLSLTIA